MRYNRFKKIAAFLLAVVAVVIIGCGSGFTREFRDTDTKNERTGEARPTAQLDLNRASKQELVDLPGIGEAYAQRIIDHRPYKRKDELVEKKVIPQSAYDKIKDRV